MKSKGICNTCKHERTCILIQGEKSPIFNCEKYELVPTQTKQEQNSKIEVTEEISLADYSGICINCDYRVECTLRCKTSVIWHCEEHL